MERPRGGLLRHRNFRLLWVGETLSETGDSLANVLVPLLAVTALRAIFFATAYQVYLPSIVPAGDLVEGNAKLQGSASAALIGGRSAAGALAQAVGAATALTLNAVSFVVSAACLLRIGEAPAPGDGGRRGKARTTIRAEVAEGVRFCLSDRYLRPIAAFAIAGNLAYSGYVSLAVLFLVRSAGFGSAEAGVLLGAAARGRSRYSAWRPGRSVGVPLSQRSDRGFPVHARPAECQGSSRPGN